LESIPCSLNYVSRTQAPVASLLQIEARQRYPAEDSHWPPRTLECSFRRSAVAPSDKPVARSGQRRSSAYYSVRAQGRYGRRDRAQNRTLGLRYYSRGRLETQQEGGSTRANLPSGRFVKISRMAGPMRQRRRSSRPLSSRTHTS